MLRGLATVSFYAEDMEAARRWYTDVLGVEPYFAVPGDDGHPAYVEFRIGDHEDELGIINSRYAPHHTADRPAGAVVFWHVDDVEKTMATLLSQGAREHEPITPRSEGFVTASVVDPFGNILGIMYNPHYLEQLQPIAR